MANSKIYRDAQNRVPVNTRSPAGFLAIPGAVKSLKKTQMKKCEPYKLLQNISKKLRINPNIMFVKILGYDKFGNVKLIIKSGITTDKAYNSQSGYIITGNLFKEEIKTIVKLPSRVREKEPGKTDPNISRYKRNTARTSRRYRKGRRLIARRARLYQRRHRRLRRRIRPTKDQLEIKNFHENQVVQPMDFNTQKSIIPSRDFSSILEASNSNLYTDEIDEEIEIDAIPGVAKFIGLGVDTDRPSIISSFEAGRTIYDDSLDVYEQLVLDRDLKLKTIYDNLEPLEEYDLEKLLETQRLIQGLTAASIDSISIISKVDEGLMDEISILVFDLAQTIGFSSNTSLTQVYIQTLYDLGAISEFGPFSPNEASVERILSVKEKQINIDTFHGDSFSKSFYSNTLYAGGRVRDISDRYYYRIGNYGSYLAYQNSINPPELRVIQTSSQLNQGSVRISTSVDENDLASLMQTIYQELLFSKLVSEGDQTIQGLKKTQGKNLTEIFFGGLAKPNKTLNGIQVPSGLASIVKYNSGGINYYPMEESVSIGGGLDGRTFLDAVVQPAIGALIEDTDPNFDLLNSWIENAKYQLLEYFQYHDVIVEDGGCLIVLNEIILAMVDCLTESDKKLGLNKHPFSNSMTKALTDGQLTPEVIAKTLEEFIDTTKNNDGTALSHLYNTFGYCNFSGQKDILYKTRSVYGISQSDINRVNFETSVYNPTNTSRAIKLLNSIYEESTRFCELIENGIMTSIEILLSRAGLIKSTVMPDYNTPASGFFEEAKPHLRRLSKDPRPGKKSPDIGTYEMTTFSGVPRLAIRKALMAIAGKIFLDADNRKPSSLVSNNAKGLLKLAKIAVENLDDTVGPVRWKVTHGPWPLGNEDFEDLQESVYEKFIPTDVKEAFENGPEIEVGVDENGIPIISVEDPLEGWGFIESADGFCPITLMLDGEDNSKDPISFVRGNRSLMDDVVDDLVLFRKKAYKMKNLLESPISAYSKFPEKVEEVASTVSLDNLKELAQFPAIDGQEIVKFTSSMQIAAAKKSLKTETPNQALRYLPNKYAISKNEYFVAMAFLRDYIDKSFSREDKTIIQSIGIPAGYLSSQKLVGQTFSLTRSAEYMFFPNCVWSDKKNIFHSNIYLIPGSFTLCDKSSSFSKIILNSKFYIAGEGMDKFVRYEEAKEYIGTSDASTALQNHVLDYSIYLVLKILTGVELNEDTFRINKLANTRYIGPDAIKEIPNLIKKFPENFDAIFKEDKVVTFLESMKIFSDSTDLEINAYLGALDCRLLSPEYIAKHALAPRIFDRVFNLLVHPDEHYTDKSVIGLKRESIDIDGIKKFAYRINLKDGAINSIRNDHFASYYYGIKK